MIRLNCFFKANEGLYEDALEAAIALTAESQKEEGCISYDCFESATRADVLLICETWESPEALEAHKNTDHYKEYVAKLASCGMTKVEEFNF